MEKEEVFTTGYIKVSREDDVEALNKDNNKAGNHFKRPKLRKISQQNLKPSPPPPLPLTPQYVRTLLILL